MLVGGNELGLDLLKFMTSDLGCYCKLNSILSPKFREVVALPF
jgi:hypothetical protein